jgi:uncharacterized phage protein (TIGR01671 family)
MKIIKFRAWYDGKMIYEKNILHLSNEDNLILRLAKFWSNVRNESIIMQFTGLHDKNDTEIYEGDIYKESDGKIYVCEYSQDDAAFLWVCIDEDETCTMNYGIDSKDCQIIGNIYENPDLVIT